MHAERPQCYHRRPDMQQGHPNNITQQVMLSGECRFGIGGPADYFARASTAADISSALGFARREGLKCFVYSGGSNLFFDDAGFRGLVLRIQGGAWRVEERNLRLTRVGYRGRDSLGSVDGIARSPVHGELSHEGGSTPTPCVHADSGVENSLLVRELAQRGLGGLEWLGNIPGSLGGALAGNAGCYGHAIAEVLVEAELLDSTTLERQTVGPEYFEFAYRHSRVKDDATCIITAMTLRLTPREGAVVLREVQDELEERRRKHPHDARCAGSFFKNPSRERPAWRIIEEAGLRGAYVGNAVLHPKHLNFLVNEGAATSADILALARKVKRVVAERCAVSLEAEVRYVGESGIEPV